MAAPTRPRSQPKTRAQPERHAPGLDPDGGAGGIHELLTKAVEEVARLLDADGAMVYLIDPASGKLRFAHDAGIRSARSRAWVRGLELEPGTGMFGRAVIERAVVVTHDYPNDPSFRHAERTDDVVADIGIRSMVVAPLVGGGEVFGAMGTFSRRADAFDQAQIALVRSLADHAAAAMANTRLIEDLDRSRSELADRAEVERSLREINVRISAAADLSSVLQLAVDEAARLLRGDGARIDLIDPRSGLLRWAYASGAVRPDDEVWPDDPDETLEQGISGQAVIHGRPFWTGDYQRDERFPHGRGADSYVEHSGIRSVIAAPLMGEGGTFGTLTVYTGETDAWGETDALLLEAISSQAAIAITNARLIDELERSREENSKRADAERTLREIAARVSSILDPATVLTRIVAESARLLGSDGARIDLWDEDLGALRWAYSAGDAMSEVPEWGRTGGLKPRQAVAGLAYDEQRPVMTEDYLADERFETTPEIEAFVRKAGIRAVISVPLGGESDGPLGVLSVVSREAGAYSETEVELLTALATHASIAITNAHLMEELARSREDIERRADAEASLRQIAARITVLREPDEVLQHVVDEAQRLLRADGALIDQYDPETGTLHWAYDAGLPEDQREAVKMTNLRLGEGVSGKAVAEGRVIHVGDYLEGEFRHDDLADSLVERSGVRDLIAAPIIGESGPLGAIEVMSRRPYAFDDLDAAVLGSLAEQAAIAITNARLIDELERSKVALARRAETERSLRDITARIAALTDPDEVLERVVEDAIRLLATDGAHLTRMGPTGTYLVPVVVAGAGDDATREWLMTMEFPLGAGINGLAAEQGAPAWTFDYLADPRIPHEPDDDVVAERLVLRGMAAAPLRAPGGEVIGTLAISTTEPRTFEADDLDLLQGLADQAAIALTNSNLLARVTREEARFRGLVQTTPDVIWRADPDGVFTFMADTAEALFGWPIKEIVGKPFAFLTDPDSMALAVEKYAAVGATAELVERVPLLLVRRDGTRFAAEVTTTGVFEDGRWVGAQGTVRDVSDRERLERELRESEERYRFLVQNAPDVVWSIGADARITFLSHAVERLTGFGPNELIGQHFGALVHASSNDVAEIDWTTAMSAPSQEIRGRVNLQHRDGSAVPAEFIAVATLDADGRFAGANGSVRDMRERDRLERELRASEERYRFLVQNSPDAVFSTDVDGNFTFISAAIERLTGVRDVDLIGKHFGTIVEVDDSQAPGGRWETLATDPDQEVQAAQILRGLDGRRTPVDVRAVGIYVDGRFSGIQGAARDVSDQVRLERELRRQAGELAAGEERAHLARELHDSVTQALFSMSLVSRSVEMLLDTDPAAARSHLTQLRELQREALAEMRALIFELRPGNLEQDGLVRALKTHTAALQGRLGLPVVVESDLEDRLPLAAEEVLYRIAQEALHNVVKHAAARQVRVQVNRHQGGVRLRVEDDGKGFDPTSVPDGHLGLAGMRARADRVGATFDCASRPGTGTSIEVAFGPVALARLEAAAATALADPSIRDG